MNTPHRQSAGQFVAAVLTPRGRGAVATIRIQGDVHFSDSRPTMLFRPANGQPLHEQPLGRICFGHWGQPVPEEVVVCRIDESTTELHCHGGDAAVRRIINDLQSAGCAIQTWQQLIAKTSCQFDAECRDVLTRATTLRTAEILLRQHAGVLKSALDELLQFARTNPNGEQSEFSESTDRSSRRDIAALQNEFIHRLDELLGWSNFGLHLSRPWNVVLAGRPNVGKSSLINALLGYSRSIVFDQPGTTRDVVTAETALNGWPIQFSDTAGIRKADDELESAGIDRAREQLRAADCQLILLDTSQPPHPDDHQLLSDWPDAVVVAHKCDLPNIWAGAIPPTAIPVSSLKETGIIVLADQLVGHLIPELPDSNSPIPISTRQVELLTTTRAAAGRSNWSTCCETLSHLLS